MLKSRWVWVWIFLGGVYLVTRLIALLVIPIFADEAIYIYWAQLTISDWERFLFYPLNDGKTPLFIWVMMPFLKIWVDPLLAGRLVAVLFGLGQLILTFKLTLAFTKRRKLALLGVILFLFVPGFIFNQRLALMDSALTFFITSAFYWAYLGLQALEENKKVKLFNKKLALAGLFFGLALWTKFSALLFLPVLVTLGGYFWSPPFKGRKLGQGLLSLGLIAGLGLALLYTLKISPAFAQLFARGGDFLYSPGEFLAKPGEILGRNLSFCWQILVNYLTLPLAVTVPVFALLVFKKERRALWVLVSGLAFLLPVVILGSTIYPRYLLPVLPFFLLSFCLSWSHLPRPARLLAKFSTVLVVIYGGHFLLLSWVAPARLPLLATDYTQYFDEWSAGYGIRETVTLLEVMSETTPTLVLTEGHIGTLPDGLQVYFFKLASRNRLRIESIGQPVKIENLEKVQELIDTYEQVVLVVNSHRLEVPELEGQLKLVQEFPRPRSDTPTLQIWQLK